MKPTGDIPSLHTEPILPAVWVQIAKYLCGDLNAKEQVAFAQWLSDDPDRATIVAQVQSSWNAVESTGQLVDAEVALAKFFDRAEVAWPDAVKLVPAGVAEELSTGERRDQSRLGTRLFRSTTKSPEIFLGRASSRGMWSAATALVLGLVVLAIGWNMMPPHTGRRRAMSASTYATGNGERATITLPDGGTVALNVASRLEVPVDYVAGNHTVRLVGEGWFTVPHQEGVPFTVLAGGTVTRVLGTSFVVRRYATDTATVVAVREGRVAIGSAVVTARQLVEVGRSGVAHVRPSNGSMFTFATGILTLNSLPLPAAFKELDRWFDADIRLGDTTLATRHMKGEFAAGSLADLQVILEGTFNARVVRDGRVLTLYPR